MSQDGRLEASTGPCTEPGPSAPGILTIICASWPPLIASNLYPGLRLRMGASIIMRRNASQTESNVSAGEAIDALEVLANVLYLTARNADDGERVRSLVDEADSCVSTLAQFMKTQNVTFAQKPHLVRRGGKRV